MAACLQEGKQVGHWLKSWVNKRKKAVKSLLFLWFYLLYLMDVLIDKRGMFLLVTAL